MNDLTMAAIQIRSNSPVQSVVPKAGGQVSSPAPVAVPPPGEFVSSPKGAIDAESGLYVIKFRDSGSGEVTMQYPPEKVVKEYRRSAAIAEQNPKANDSPRTESSKAKTTSGSVEV